MPMKIGNKAVNKMMLNGKEVLKVVVNGNTVYSSNQDFVVNLTLNQMLGNTGTASTASTAALNTNVWIEAYNQANSYIANENISISGNMNMPYSLYRTDAKYIQINGFKLKNNTTTARNYVKIRIYNSSNQVVYDSLSDSSYSVNLPANTTTSVDFNISLKLDANTAYTVRAYTGAGTPANTTYRDVNVTLVDVVVAPGLVSY